MANGSVMEIQNLVVNHESRPVKTVTLFISLIHSLKNLLIFAVNSLYDRNTCRFCDRDL